MPTIDTPSKNLTSLFPMIGMLKLPSRLEPYRPMIEEEIRWCLHTQMLMGRRQRCNTNPVSFFMTAVDRVIAYYAPLKQIPYANIYEICTLNGMQSDHFWTAKQTFQTYLEKYKKKILG